MKARNYNYPVVPCCSRVLTPLLLHITYAYVGVIAFLARGYLSYPYFTYIP